ncbi:2'-5' RNA ligase family protein [Nocardioides antri]|uniref:2'-5' RNA ligase family protein n=1 Tax=Nocardioides antri TaxID=2607659 RepID=A0A5B1M676_9ACTN|nr:2'-5' RNA ligase family protein [Nocardioides antri]KAA1427170.1 2'-5' RNA ligase family protein [Nocardioides antri]
MALAVCLLFDTRTDRLVRQLWTRLEDMGVGTLASHTHGRHLPHLSYAVLREWDLERVQDALAALADGGPVTASCQGAVLFPRGRVALAPAVDAAVLARQERVVAALERTGADLHRHYRPGHWLPHVSVATRATAEQLALTATAITDVLPLEVYADRAALVDSATGRRWLLPGVP